MTIENIFNKYKQLLLNGTKYGGDSSIERKSISASEFNKPLLQLYYRYKYGIPKQNDIGVNTLGSLIHKGIETILEQRDDILTEYGMKYTFDNGWSLTGTADIIDKELKTILDIKFTKHFVGSDMKTKSDYIIANGEKDDYIVQLSVQRYLWYKETKESYDAGLLLLNKDAGLDFKRGKEVAAFEILDCSDMLLSYNEVESKFNSLVEKLTYHIENNIVPNECEDLMFRKFNGKTIKMRCKYCAYNKKCKYNNSQRMHLQTLLSKL